MSYNDLIAEAKRLYSEAREISTRIDEGEEVDAQDLEKMNGLLEGARKAQERLDS